jgi:hypothetical protein
VFRSLGTAEQFEFDKRASHQGQDKTCDQHLDDGQACCLLGLVVCIEQVAQFTNIVRCVVRVAAAAKQGLTEAERSANVTRVENEILATKRQSMAIAATEYRAHIDVLNAEANRHLAEIQRIEEAKRQLTMTTEEKIRELRRQGMTEFEATEDRKRQIVELQTNARDALAAGEFEQAKQLAQKAMDLAVQVGSAQTAEAKKAEEAKKQSEQAHTQVVTLESQAREAWVNLSALPAGNNYFAVVSRSWDIAQNLGCFFGVGQIGSQISFYLYWSSNGVTTKNASTPWTGYAPNRWVHVAWVRRGGSFRVFVDGTRQAQRLIATQMLVNRWLSSCPNGIWQQLMCRLLQKRAECGHGWCIDWPQFRPLRCFRLPVLAQSSSVRAALPQAPASMPRPAARQPPPCHADC